MPPPMITTRAARGICGSTFSSTATSCSLLYRIDLSILGIPRPRGSVALCRAGTIHAFGAAPAPGRTFGRVDEVEDAAWITAAVQPAQVALGQVAQRRVRDRKQRRRAGI